jgi:hypothetical protein
MRLGPTACVLVCLVSCADDAPRNETSIDNVVGVLDASTPLDARSARDSSLEARSDARVSAPTLDCPAMWAECARPSSPWRVIAEAAQFGPGARFRALAGDLVLVQGGNATWRVVRFGPDLRPGEPSVVHSLAFPEGEWDARGLARKSEVVAVVACGARCSLLEGSLTASALREVPGGQLPEGYQVQGLQADGATLCVFGSDISCFDDGRWQSTLAEGTLAAGEEVISLALARPRSLALTRSGRVFAALLGASLAEWVEEAPVEGASSVSIAGRRALFRGADFWLERTDGQEHSCGVPDGVAAVLVGLAGSASVLTGRGDLLRVQASGWCRSQQVSSGEVLAASSGPCGGEPRVITESQLLGDNRCDLE